MGIRTNRIFNTFRIHHYDHLNQHCIHNYFNVHRVDEVDDGNAIKATEEAVAIPGRNWSKAGFFSPQFRQT